MAKETYHLWRVFPWNLDATEGAPFSPQFIPPGQGSGRFDLGGDLSVLYLAETPVHAIAEKIQRYRGQELTSTELREFGFSLSLVEALLTIEDSALILDLSDPEELARHGFRPDTLMSRDRTRTQAVAREIHRQSFLGLRCWSALSGDWHSTVLFVDRLGTLGTIVYQTPVELTIGSPLLAEAAAELSIRITR
jgi:hypothetical protein